MDETQTLTPAPLRIVAIARDPVLEAMIVSAAHLASASDVIRADEAVARREIEAATADVVVLVDAPPCPTGDAIALAERLLQVEAPVPVLLIARSELASADRLRLASRGIDTLDAAALDVDALARRLMLHAGVRAREKRARRAQALLRTQEALIRGLAHDLRTPLMAINLSAEVASVRSADDAVQQAMRRIRSSTQRMARSLDHLSNVARVDADARRGPREVADLGRLAQAALESVRGVNPAVDVDVVEHGDLRLHADAAALQRALAHLLSTALAHAHGDRVGVRIDGSAADRVWFEVTLPRAIPSDEQDRLGGAGSRDRPGLGLQAIDAIVQAHAGSVVGRSKAPDGTVLELLLPRGVGD
ncbi:MAG TPA: HAMP domain-containing sensor histidine kinase [Myxococcota bacterium]|nr:HAMP domain-containing sensor histidine kinase [Myxococcota bacterium]